MAANLPMTDPDPAPASPSGSLRLDLPPSPAARIAVPDAFGTRFAIFGDAEEEFDWAAPLARKSTATTAIAQLRGANRRFVDAGCVPTYLVDWPVVDNPASAATIATMLAAGECRVGTQLHPWVNPPFEEAVSPRNSYLGNLPPALQRAKLAALTNRIDEVLGVRPIVYRAGRYGVGRDTAGMLAEAGYALDVSVRAGFDYSAGEGPDFSDHPIWPWRVGPTLAALPLTTAFTGLLRTLPGSRHFRHMQGVLARTHLLNRVPLTPEGVPLADACDGIAALLDDGHRLFSLSFHTPTVVPGHTPYVRDAADLRTFWQWWDGVFSLFAQRGVTGVGLDEIVAALAPEPTA
jgi:hypothetical protein